MAISRAQLLKQLVPGLNGLFGDEYKRYPEQFAGIYEKEGSNRSFEEELRVTGLGIAETKLEGESVRYDQMQESWVARFNHETVTKAFAFTEEAMEDNLYVSLARRGTKSMARSFAETKNIKAMVPFNLGFTSYQTGDAVTFFNTAHPLVDGGVNANRPTTSGDLNETTLEAAIIAMQAWTDDRGILINAKPRKLLIPAALEFTAERILRSELRPGVMDNDVNAIRSTGRVPGGWMVNNYLTDTNAWYLITDIPNGLKHFQRVELKTGMDGDFDTGNVKYKGRERYVFGVADPLCVYANAGST